MSAIAKPSSWISPEEYFEGEKLADVRHEYVDGEVYAMAGSSVDHQRIAGNIYAQLHARLRGSKCEPFNNDFKLHIPPVGSNTAEYFYYPDVMVACDPTDNAEYFRERPTVIFEVLSPSTERIDHGEKAQAYWRVGTVKVYVLVEQSRIAATVLRRSAAGWTRQTIEGPTNTLSLPEISVELPLALIYERTSLL